MLHFAVHKEQALHSRPGFSIFKNAPLEISAYTAPIGQKYLQKNLFTNTDPAKITKSKIPPTEHKGFTPGQCPGTIYWPNISHGPCFFQVKTPLHINITK